MIPSDQCIEQTINREQKGSGGITGYSTTTGTVQRWVLTSHVSSQCMAKLESTISLHHTKAATKDLGTSRMKFDEACVSRAYDILSSWGNPFHAREELLNLCSGIKAPPDVTSDILLANEKGKCPYVCLLLTL